MSGTCHFDGCTIDETGVCALERDPATCINRVTPKDGFGTTSEDAVGFSEGVLKPADRLGTAVLNAPVQMSSFTSSRALGLGNLDTLMGSRYVNVVGILGDPESGKTACLASLYLLVSHSKLEGWSFADSKSLMAFESISRGARDWNNGDVPEQMTVHTELADDVSPGFLHLKLVRQSDGRRVDLALPDIPGEWTQALVTTAQSERFDFMKSSETIWIVLDGRTLCDIEKRQGQIARVGQLAGRLHTLLSGRIPRLLIVVTHRDLHTVSEDVAKRLLAELGRRGMSAEIVGVAPFSDKPDEVPAGFGIAELIDRTVGKPSEPPIFWQATEPTENDRAYLSYRRN